MCTFGELIVTAVHELRNPLSPIVTALQLMKEADAILGALRLALNRSQLF